MKAGSVSTKYFSMNGINDARVSELHGEPEANIYNGKTGLAYMIWPKNAIYKKENQIGYLLASLDSSGKISVIDDRLGQIYSFPFYSYEPKAASDGALWYVRSSAGPLRKKSYELMRYDPTNGSKRIIHEAAAFAGVLVKPEKEW